MIYYTSICANYLPKAMALAESVKAHCRDAVFVLCLVEREVPQVAAEFPYFDQVILAKDAGWEDFDQFIFRHSIVEASTAVKPQFLRHLMESRYPDSDKFVYLDPDVLVYSDFAELESVLDTATVAVCPHLLRPGNIDMEISALAHGTYNLGFVAVSRSDNAKRFLDWWAERLFLFCYDDKSRGIFTDQKWIDLAPSFFDVHILKHHGYDFATWSLQGSDVRRSEDGSHVVNGDPLRFIHFSGLDSGMIDRAMDWWLTKDNRSAFEALYRDYQARLQGHGQRELGKTPWSYARYADGSVISNESRVRYRAPALWAAVPQPFDANDAQIQQHDGGSLANASAEGQVPTLRMRSNPGLLDKVAWSTLEIGFGPTIAKALRKLVGIKR